MKLLDKYLFSQVFWSFVFGLLIVIIVWITPELLPKIVREVISKQTSLYDGVLYILYELPEVFVKSLPMGMLIGSLLVFDRLSKDSEITAMRACGISIYRMLMSILVLGAIGSVISFGVNELLVPPASLAQEKISNKGQLVSKHFTFIDKTRDEQLKQVMLIGHYDGKNVRDIQLVNFEPFKNNKTRVSKIIAASSAIWKNNQWNLVKGMVYKLSPNGIYENTSSFEEMPFKTNLKAFRLLKKSIKKAKNMNLFETYEYISLLMESHHKDEARYYLVRFHQKFSQPLAAILLGIVGLILGIHPPRTSRFIGYTVGMFVILFYYFFWPFSMALGNIGTIPPFLAAWLPNIIAVIIGFIILKYKDF